MLIWREIQMAQALSEDGKHFDRQGAAEYTRTARKRQGLTTQGMLWSSIWRAIARPMGAGEPLPVLDDSIVTAEWSGRPSEPLYDEPRKRWSPKR